MGKVRLGKPIFVALLVLYSAYVVITTRGDVETPFSRRMRQIELSMKDLDKKSDAYLEKDALLSNLRKQELSVADAQKRAAELEAKLIAMPKDAPERLALESKLTDLHDQIPSWRDIIPINLGLDLRGGTEVRLRIASDRQERLVAALEKELSLTTPGTKAFTEKKMELDTAVNELHSNIKDAVDVIRTRLNSRGLSEIPVTKEGVNCIRVQLPGLDSESAKSIIDTIRRSGRLEFRLVDETPEKVNRVKQMAGIMPNTKNIDLSPAVSRPLKESELDKNGRGIDGGVLYDWMREPPVLDKKGNIKSEGRDYLVVKDVSLTGNTISSARVTRDDKNPLNYAVNITFNDQGRHIFSRITSEHKGELLAIVLDGQLKSAPKIQTAITDGRAIITGNFDEAEARMLTVVLKAGSLPVDIVVEMENTVGPTLGEDSIQRGMQAILYGLILVLIFMALYYLIAGAVTDVCLFINLLFIVAVLIRLNAVLTLPGIAGLILTVGMAVDANVLIFERIREEFKKGASLARAIENGYDRAFVTILDANITTLITTLILIHFGTEEVRGFAVTLTIGILTSMFVSLFVTRVFFDLLQDLKLIKTLSMNRLIENTSIDFSSMRRWAMGISGSLALIGAILFFSRGNEKYAQDFTGGTLVQINLSQQMSIETVRERLQKLTSQNFGDIGVQSIGGAGTSFLLSTSATNIEGEGSNAPEAFKKALANTFPLVQPGIVSLKGLDRKRQSREEYEVVLSLSRPRSPQEVANILAGQEFPFIHVRDAEDPLPDAETSLSADIEIRLDKSDKLADVDAIKAALIASAKKATQDLFDPETAFGSVSEKSRDEQIVVTVPLMLKTAASKDVVRDTVELLDIVRRADVKLTDTPEVATEFSTTPTSSIAMVVTLPDADVAAQNAPIQYLRTVLGRLRNNGDISFSDPFPRFNSVGPQVASEMKQKAVLALFFSMIAIFFYIWLRFQFRIGFSIGACLALLHDVCFTLGVLTVLDYAGYNLKIDLTIVAALLTIVGYSLNDTIVVFDRIRENLVAGGRKFTDTINLSVNQTLSRTLLTSMTTLLVVVALLLFGGEVIFGFALSLFIGVLIGTYSSIFIASPVLIEIEAYRHRKSEEQKSRNLQG